MKVKFLGWEYIDEDSVFNEEEEEIISVNGGDWKFEVDGKEYYWYVRTEEYFDNEGDGKGSGILVVDMNDGRKTISDNLWSNWNNPNSGRIRDGESIDEKFNNNLTVGNFVTNLWELIDRDIKIDGNEYNTVNILNVENMRDWGGSKTIIGKIIELDE
jgi:hypothetical protein|tara:strand:+ start:374 stop:847 length:474 start_codon:yes stop_codon:yes gene_type:complete